jgi:hypothetical protein
MTDEEIYQEAYTWVRECQRQMPRKFVWHWHRGGYQAMLKVIPTRLRYVHQTGEIVPAQPMTELEWRWEIYAACGPNLYAEFREIPGIGDAWARDLSDTFRACRWTPNELIHDHPDILIAHWGYRARPRKPSRKAVQALRQWWVGQELAS